MCVTMGLEIEVMVTVLIIDHLMMLNRFLYADFSMAAQIR